MTVSRIRAISTCAIGVLTIVVCRPRSLAAQEAPGLTMPVSSLRQIAVDFDTGRNTIYCYHGMATASGSTIHVDSVRVISSPSECEGVGVGFISRITDRPMMAAMLRGILDTHPGFRIISAFYGTEQIDVDGQSIRAARALSVLRKPRLAAATFGS